MVALAPAIPPGFGLLFNEGMNFPEGPISGPVSQIIGYIMSDGNGNQFVVNASDPRMQPVAAAMTRGLQIAEPILKKKAKRRVSKYQREFGKQLKKLKRKHPRTPVTKLMKRAHSATKKIMRRKK